jgi:hypothetical protein
MLITEGLLYFAEKLNLSHAQPKVHIIKLEQKQNENLTLLISKVSEAILPNTQGNHIGEGTNIDDYLNYQKDVRFIINGGFNHYRKNFYNWPHQTFEVGSPVGLVKIRDHYFEDYLDLEYYGFLTQQQKGDVWEIKKPHELDKNAKYILGCTPLLIFNKQKIELPLDLMQPLKEKQINPPSILAHGLENHPRTAIGIKDGNLYFVVVENEGCSLLDLQNFGQFLELDYFLNLDGGGSSQFRIIQDNQDVLKNNISQEDKNRVLGHVLVLFDKRLFKA